MTGDRSNRPPAPTDRGGEPAQTSARPEIEAFLQRVRTLAPATASGARGRLIFSLDATMSRQPTWDSACSLQADMFREMARLSRGAYCRFDTGAAQQLRELLRAVAAYAAGGIKALTALSQRHGQGATKLLEQLR